MLALESDVLRVCSGCLQAKQYSDFYKKHRRNGKDGLEHICKPCRNRRAVRWHQRNPEKAREKNALWRKNNLAKARETAIAFYRKKTYGLSSEEYKAKKAGQNGICAMCHKVVDDLVLDHCHSSKIVRDFICNHCNTFIGHIEKYPDLYAQAVEYIQKHKGMVFPCPTK